ncbi:MAG: hypothetical protein ACP5HU_10385 [Phycisphaerae bacterium]
MCSSGQYETICKDEFASIHDKLDKLDEAIRGNGRTGIQVRLDRLEQDARRQGRLIWLIAGAVATAICSAVIVRIAG